MELGNGNESSKNSDPEREAEDGGGMDSNSNAYPKLRVQIGGSNHGEVNAEMIDGSSSSTSSELHHKTAVENGVMIPSKHVGSPSSSASSVSSSEDLFQVDRIERPAPIAPSNPSNELQHGDTPPSFRCQENGTSSSNPFKEGFPSSGLLPTKSAVFQEPGIPITSPPTQSPPTQIMERLEGYDPYRIPSTVFKRSGSTTPLDWSVASNESLFSIHVGNNSFSKDHPFAVSGELVKSGELLMYSPKPQFGTPLHASQPLVPIMEMDNSRESFQSQTSTAASVAPELVVENRKIDEATKAAVVEVQNEQKRPVAFASRKASGLSTLSIGSADSGKSFAFPILSERVKSGSDNVTPVNENHQANDEEVDLQPSAAAPVTPNSGYCGWFSCFSSCCLWSFPCQFCRRPC